MKKKVNKVKIVKLSDEDPKGYFVSILLDMEFKFLGFGNKMLELPKDVAEKLCKVLSDYGLKVQMGTLRKKDFLDD